jgi:outer membrane receptor protein involved in Fe transport
LAIASNSALAQAPVAERDEIIEEIIVTAQKRENLARKVPISLFAESGHYLRHAGIDSVGMLGDLAAGVETVSQHTGKMQLVIRGVTNLGDRAQDSTASVGYYVDETPLSSFLPTSMPDMGLWDVERVEILRGPQGTLFGEGSMGGTIRVITRKPDPTEFGGEVVGSWETVTDGGTGYGLRATLNAPLVDDELAIRINLSTADRPGYIDVPDLGIDDANQADHRHVRLALGWAPNDRMDLQLSYIDQSLDLESNSWTTSRGVLDPQNMEPLGLWAPTLRLSPQENHFRLSNLTIKYDFDWAAFVSATSYFDSERYFLEDVSHLTPVYFGVPGSFTNELDLPLDSLTQEFRLSSDNQTLNWTVGAYFKRNQRSGGQILAIDLPDIGLLDVLRTQYDLQIDSYAVFAEVDYKLIERWALKAGGRYYSDDRTTLRTSLTSSPIWGAVAGEIMGDSGSNDDFAPSISLSWTGEENLFFVRAAKGFRAGGINLSAIYAPDVIPVQYEAEELWTYETGLKSRMWDNRLQLNAYVYFNSWDSLQVLQWAEGLYVYTSNAGKAEALGTEIELTVRATDNLTLGAFLALIDNEMKETIVDSNGRTVVEKGNSIPFTPKTKLSLTAQYSRPMTADLKATAFARWSYRSETHTLISNAPIVENDSYDLAFVRFGVEGEAWAAYLSVDNLFDEEGTVFKQTIEPLPMAFPTYVEPRTLRLELQWAF